MEKHIEGFVLDLFAVKGDIKIGIEIDLSRSKSVDFDSRYYSLNLDKIFILKKGVKQLVYDRKIVYLCIDRYISKILKYVIS